MEFDCRGLGSQLFSLTTAIPRQANSPDFTGANTPTFSFDQVSHDRDEGTLLGFTRSWIFCSKKRGSRQMFVPLSHPPGHALADFGEALIELQVWSRRRIFALDLPHSEACYIRAYPAANTEAWLDGHVHAFAFIGAVSQSVLSDNDRCLVAKTMPNGERQRTQRFSAMLSHYVIQDRYGRPGKGNDKSKVEGLVGYSRRNFMAHPLMHASIHCRAADAARCKSGCVQ